MSCTDFVYEPSDSCEYPEIISFNEDSTDKFLDTLFETEPKLKCGEIVLTSNRTLNFSCSFCKRRDKNLDTFLRHILKEHLMLTKAERQALLHESPGQRPLEVRKQSRSACGKKLTVMKEDEENLSAINRQNKSQKPGQRVKSENAFTNIRKEIDEFTFDNEELSSGYLDEGTATKLISTNDENCDNLQEMAKDISSLENGIDNNLVSYEIEVLQNPLSINIKEEIVTTKIETEQDTLNGDGGKVTIQGTEKSVPSHIIAPKYKRLVCRVCSQAFKSTPLLNAHMNDHVVERPFACEYCEARFKDKSNLKVHINRHLGIKPYTCTHCGKSFTSSTELKLHVRSHTGERPYVCEECGLCFSSSARLRGHRQRHYNYRPCKCETCGKHFYDHGLLRDHEISHSTERPFACDVCSATFTRRKALVQHEKLHSEVKNYECKICEKKFAQNAGLWWHMKQNHGTPV